MTGNAATTQRRKKKRMSGSRKEILVYWSGSGFDILHSHPADATVQEPAPRWGMALGYTAADRGSLIRMLRRGLPSDAFDRLCAALDITCARLAGVTGIALRTLARRKQEGRLSPQESERVFRVAALFDRAVEALGDADAARRWLASPAVALGASPLDHADTELGAREVEELLGRLEHGVFS